MYKSYLFKNINLFMTNYRGLKNQLHRNTGTITDISKQGRTDLRTNFYIFIRNGLLRKLKQFKKTTANCLCDKHLFKFSFINLFGVSMLW